MTTWWTANEPIDHTMVKSLPEAIRTTRSTTKTNVDTLQGVVDVGHLKVTDGIYGESDPVTGIHKIGTARVNLVGTVPEYADGDEVTIKVNEAGIADATAVEGSLMVDITPSVVTAATAGDVTNFVKIRRYVGSTLAWVDVVAKKLFPMFFGSWLTCFSDVEADIDADTTIINLIGAKTSGDFKVPLLGERVEVNKTIQEIVADDTFANDRAVANKSFVDDWGEYVRSIHANIAQTVITAASDNVNTDSTFTYTDLPSFVVALTTIMANAKLKLNINIYGATANTTAVFKVQRSINGGAYADVTPLGDAAGNRTRCSFMLRFNNDAVVGNVTFDFLDSITADAGAVVSYKVLYMLPYNNTTTQLLINSTANSTDSAIYTRTVSTMTVQEIPAS